MLEQVSIDCSEQGLNSAALLSRIYLMFASAYEYPDKEMVDLIRSGEFADSFRELFDRYDSDLSRSIPWDALKDAGSDEDDLMVEYTRLFDVNATGVACPLYGGSYVDARMKNMEDMVRFYNYFGLSTSDVQEELPDHICIQLEFLHFLVFREAQAFEAGEDASDCMRAQRDFMQKFPTRWIPKLSHKLTESEAMPFFAELTKLLDRTLNLVFVQLINRVGKGTGVLGKSSIEMINM